AAAEELAEYLKRITGGKFEIQTGDGTRGLVVGTLAEFPDERLNEALAVRNGFDGKEAFAIQTSPGRVRLLGTTELGVSHAVVRLIESLGHRRFFPAPEWEVLPHRPTLSVAL